MPQPKKRVNTGKSQSGAGKSSTPRPRVSKSNAAKPTARATHVGVGKATRGSTKVHTGPGQAKGGKSTTPPRSASTRMKAATRAEQAAAVANRLGGASVGPFRVAGHDITVAGRVHQSQPRHLNVRLSGRRFGVSINVKRSGDTRTILSGLAKHQHRDSHGRFA